MAINQRNITKLKKKSLIFMKYEQQVKKEKKKNTENFIFSVTNYNTEMKHMPINMDYCVL